MKTNQDWDDPERRVFEPKRAKPPPVNKPDSDPERHIFSPAKQIEPVLYPTDPERQIHTAPRQTEPSSPTQELEPIHEYEARIKKDREREVRTRIEYAVQEKSKMLDLSGFKLERLPPEVRACKEVTKLLLNGNKLIEFPKPILELAQLEIVDLSDNKIVTLPKEIAQLSKLRSLRLDRNLLERLPTQIGSCSELADLSLRDNTLVALPLELQSLVNIKSISLHGNSRLELPPEIMGAPAPKLLDYYFNVIAGGGSPLNEVKLLLIGRGGVGKTATVHRLLDHGFVHQTDETMGIDITDWQLPCPGGDAVRVHVWDFAGQTVTHGLHAFFLVTEVYIFLS